MNEKTFNHKHKNKLDNPQRRKSLPATDILIKAGLKLGDSFVDVGSGTGFFTFPAFEITKQKVYALDISEEMLKDISGKIVDEDIELVLTEAYDLKIEQVGDFSLLSTVLHEIDDFSIFSKEIARVTKSGGKLLIVEWNPLADGKGPKKEHRISVEKTVSIFADYFELEFTWDISNSFYAVVLTKI